MESMRNLNTSLPSSSVRRRQHQPSAELLQAFKAAALSVTQLYKTAAAEDSSQTDDVHTAGYNEALEDVLEFLDQQNLGLGDGEGWQVRQWATQRLSSSADGRASGRDPEGGGLQHESDDDTSARSSSPVVYHKTAVAPTMQQQQPSTATSQQALDRNAQQEQQQEDQPDTRQEMFHFRSPMAMPPADTDMLNSDRQGSSRLSPPLVRLGVVPQRSGRHNGRASGLGYGAGSKRKIVLPDFFDLAGINGFADKRDGSGGNGGGGKRSRFA